MSLEVSGLSKAYGSGPERIQALDGVSFSVAPGEVVALVGNNGAGKSTLMSIVAGLLACDAGTVHVMGHETTAGRGSPTRHLGLAPQEESVYPTLTVRRNLVYFGRLAGLGAEGLDERLEELASELLLEDLLERRARDLSGGQRRRLHTALALMHSPEVLLLDEPTVGVDLDADAAARFRARHSGRGAAVLYSTHQMGEVEQIATRAVILHRGRVLAQGRVEDLVGLHAATSAELRFASRHVEMPVTGPGSPEAVHRTRSGDTVVSLRLEDEQVPVAELVAALPEHLQEVLVSVEVHRPSFERAYLSLVRAVEGPQPLAGAGPEPPAEVAS
ncbi:MAG: ABC transporter ATP-binding protein [Microthrixaceae bacterium]